jgi:hypothetical protein
MEKGGTKKKKERKKEREKSVIIHTQFHLLGYNAL